MQTHTTLNDAIEAMRAAEFLGLGYHVERRHVVGVNMLGLGFALDEWVITVTKTTKVVNSTDGETPE